MLKTHEWVTTESGPQEHMLEANPGEEKEGQASTFIRAQFMEGSLCPNQHAENFTWILSFPTSDRLCHVLTFQRKNSKVKKVKWFPQGPRAKWHYQDFRVHAPNTALYLFTWCATDIKRISITYITRYTICTRHCFLNANSSFTPQKCYEWKMPLLLPFAHEMNHLRSHSK